MFFVLSKTAGFLLLPSNFLLILGLAGLVLLAFRRRLGPWLMAISIVGLVVDSLVFLWLAFRSLQFLEGQIIGKLWMVLLATPLIAYLRRRDERLGLTPA